MSVYEPGASVERSSMHGSVSVHPTESGGAVSAGVSAWATIAANVLPATHRLGLSKSLPPIASKMSTRCATPPTVMVA